MDDQTHNSAVACHEGHAPTAAPAQDVFDEWDQRYVEHSQMWSGRPNDVLVIEVAGLSPGRALDVGCGEGADALWLAAQGWTVTGVDVSQVALDRARVAGDTLGESAQWVVDDFTAAAPRAATYDLVSVHYPALRHTPDDDAIRALLAAVAPGGTLLVVGHAPLDAKAPHHGFDPADYVQPHDVVARLGEEWDIKVNHTRPRVTPPPPDVAFTHDAVLRARRRV